MASSSSPPIRTYDVFVSFRGEDTRNNFTDFLFEALRRKGIEAFKDYENIRKGESIALELLQAIAGSRIFVVVFSKDYASSTWCLRELTEIYNCIQTSPRRVLPIFYEVSPSEVRKQGGCYEEAFAEHENKFIEDKEKMEEVKQWREVLTQVANCSGWDIRDKPQYAEIEEIVRKIKNILPHKFSSLPSDNLVGMESRLKGLEKCLCLESVNDVRVIGISGMGGIGKSTLGCALYERISYRYDSCCYINDVSKIYRGSSKLGMQKELLSKSLNEKNLEISDVSVGTNLAWTRLRDVRALIVLDNVDQVEQLNMFTGSRNTLLRDCLGGGSRIIIISRDQQILKAYGVDDVYQVQQLDYKDALRMFCRKAFKSDNIMSGYEMLTYGVLSHVDGHPLAIEVLGSALFDRDVLHWRSALARLREQKSKKIMDVLRISFDELEDQEKEIFLDIACLFVDKYNMRFMITLLNFRGFCTEVGLQVLVEKSLITIDHEDDSINMHGLLIDLGMCIVREKSPKEPRKWSRLWDHEDFHKVMSDNMIAKNLEAIVIESKDYYPTDYEDYPTETKVRVNAISKMRNLKLLILNSGDFEGSLNYLSNELVYLDWGNCPCECLPQCFEPNKLVELSLRDSSIKKLWEGRKPLHNLRSLDLSYSKNLIELPDFGEAINLEKLDLAGCEQLKQIHPSIGRLRKLVNVDLSNCQSLTKLPHFGGAINLESLRLQGCTQLRSIDPSIGLLTKLLYLSLKDCKNLESLPKSILDLNSLVTLNLSGCSKLQFLDEPRDAVHLKKLYICEASIHSQSTSSNSRQHKNSVKCLLPPSSIFPRMRYLYLGFCNLVQIPDAVGNLCCLERLDLSGNNFATLPNLKKLSKLYYLNLQHCKQLKILPGLPSRIDFPSDIWWIDRGDAGLYIFNCSELVKREHCTVCTRLCLSWMMQGAQHRELEQFIYKKELIESVSPGSEIPGWFNNQHVGNLLRMDASPVIHDNNWIGIAFCAIFVVRKETVSAMGPSNTERKFYRFGDIPVDFYGDLELVSDESDHMWLFFVSREMFIKECNSWHDVQLGSSKLDRQGFHVEVKKYGYRWVYKQDLELSNLSRKCKFWAIEQNDAVKLLQNKFAKLGL